MSTTHAPTTLAPALTDLVRQRFPLVPRPKPVCRSLQDRVARLRHLAHLAQQRTDQPLTRAAEAHNLAALIASDCGMPDLARSLCWRQFDIFHRLGPHNAVTAKLALQPLINLARLLTRDGTGGSAYQLLEALFHAVKARTDTVIDDRTIRLRAVVTDTHDHREVVCWLWAVMLADGTRALTRAGRWTEALTHLQRHHGIGERLLDGRQVAILAAQDRNHALRLLAAAQTPTPWEKAVAACLRVVRLQPAGHDTIPAVAEMVDRYLALDPVPDHAAFHTRLGLCAVELASGAGKEAAAKPAGDRLVRHALATGDAYIAWEVLTHLEGVSMTDPDRLTLTQLVDSSRLNQGTMPNDLKHDLMTSVRSSENTIEDFLSAGKRDATPG